MLRLGWGTGFFQELQAYMRSLKRMAAQAADVLYPAHGLGVSDRCNVSRGRWLRVLQRAPLGAHIMALA